MNLVDAQRTARLLFDPELTSGRLGESDVVDGQAISTLRAPPSLLLRSRLAAASSAKFGWTDGVAMQLGHTFAVRRALLGEDAVGAPRFLVRIDEFPCAGVSYAPERYGLEAFERFVDALASTGNPYLLAVVPELANEYLNASGTGDRALSDEECDLLRRLPSDKVVIAQHGTTHRTRYQNPRRHSELSGLSPADLATVVDRGRETLLRLGFQPRIFVPPFNRFDDASWNVLTDRFDVVTGGPETLRIVGALPAPVWRGSAVYVPSYRPLYARASSMIAAVEQLIDLRPGTWIPVVLHVSWEVDDGFRGLRRLADLIAPYATPWSEFLSAVDRSSGPSRPVPAGPLSA